MLLSFVMTLAETPINTFIEITQLSGSREQVARLYELGLYKGLEVSIQRKVAFGGPFIVQLGPGCVALREDEAQCIQVQAQK